MNLENRNVRRSEGAALHRKRARGVAWRGLKPATLAGALLVASFLGCGTRDEVLLGAGLTNSDVAAAGNPSGEDHAGAAGVVTGSPGVVDFILVDATTGRDMRTLTEGERIDVDGSPFTIRALVEPLPGSIVFKVDGKTFHIENAPPWTINGSDSVTGKLIPWSPATGKITIDAEPYLGPDGTGGQGSELQQDFVFD
jgi:hypothetical protein